ncbi:hypothetical protein EDC64_10986 [Aquabacter spiritensis]|uniref:Uncharacterized protein n=1 Tax=Aquabacter spiritensis TaxID=933073 RepID=A0A4R3LU76_9HYPH|nr:hypothetical protein EDC64_10986 [Aquabacter spiritensis]
MFDLAVPDTETRLRIWINRPALPDAVAIGVGE